MKRWLPFLLLLPAGLVAVFLNGLYGYVLWILAFAGLGFWCFKSLSRSTVASENLSETPKREESDSLEEKSSMDDSSSEDVLELKNLEESLQPGEESLSGEENLREIQRNWAVKQKKLNHLWKEIDMEERQYEEDGSQDLVSSSMGAFEKVKKAVTDVNGNIGQINNISDNLSNSAKEAFGKAETLQQASKHINELLDKAIRDSGSLEHKSTEVSRIVDLMSDVSSQIHVLSINASIVSARAGEYGKGFDVVAKEIRLLAMNTDQSLGTINEKIVDIQNSIKDLAEQINQANTEIRGEQEILVAVAGALEGVHLGVEVIHTISSTAMEHTMNQGGSFEGIEKAMKQLSENINAQCTNVHRHIQDLQEGIESAKHIIDEDI